MKVEKLTHTDSTVRYYYWCPGCQSNHALSEAWNFNNNFESPTFSPSVLATDGQGLRCHHYVRAGHIEYLSDCTHDLRDQTIPMETVTV